MARKKNINPLQGSLFNNPLDDLPPFKPIADFAVHFHKTAAEPKTSDSFPPQNQSATAPQLIFISFGSGSSGNCAYVGTLSEGVLIDAGVDPDTLRRGLADNGLAKSLIRGIILTHDHSDHVRFAYTILRKNPHMAVFCTPKTLNGLLRRHSISRRIKDYHRPIFKEFPFQVGPLNITAFETSHDGTDNCGYFIQLNSTAFCVATDLGCITPRVEHYMRQAQFVMLEANYDPQMLQNGPYPQHLKARIAAPNGHLSNQQSGEFLASLARSNLRHAFLCHLSRDNNTPQTAEQTVRRILAQNGFTNVGNGSGIPPHSSMPLQLSILPRFDASPLFPLSIF